MAGQPIFYSQHGEDALLAQVFNTRNGVCIEVGGFDGINLSNTYFFEKIGWKCLVVEPMPHFAQKIRANRSCTVIEAAASNTAGETEFVVAEGAEVLSTFGRNVDELKRIELAGAQAKHIRVKTDTLNQMLQSHGIDRIDFISIDVEGAELEVLEGFTLEQYKPRILLVEENDLRPDSRVRKHLGLHGYVGFKRTGCNIWYAKADDPLVTNKARAKYFVTGLPSQTKSVAKAYLPTVVQNVFRGTRKRLSDAFGGRS